MKQKKNIYFVGAGGIGMAALVRYFLSRKCNVAGYDRTCTALTLALEREGAKIVYDESAALIPEAFRDPQTTLVVYTPAIPDNHEGLCYFRNNGFEVLKRAAVLGMITRGSRGICFAGTHGKTTTSSMAAHILHNSSIGCNAFLGGILRNYDSNLLLSETSPFTVIEADEYDRSFHHLSPYIAVITSADPDHLDIYGTEEAYLESFAHFTELINSDGCLLIHEGLKVVPRVKEGVKTYTYSRNSGDFHAQNIVYGNGTITFDFVTPVGVFPGFELGVPVEINIENSIAAMAACFLTGELMPDDMYYAMRSFMGPKRRFEVWLKEEGENGKVVIDDYAHHPDELRASISSVKKLWNNRQLTVAFQPHLYSRTRDFAPEFAQALSLADNVILLDIYPAREEPIEGVTSQIIYDKITATNKTLITKDCLVETLKQSNVDVLLTVGAGDICNYLPEICKSL